MRLQLFNHIKEVLTTIKNSKGKNIFKHISFYNAQILDAENENAFYLPAVLIEFNPITWNQHSLGGQTATITFALHVLTDARNDLDKAMATNIALCDTIHYSLHNATRSNGISTLQRTNSLTDVDNAEIIDGVETYKCFVNDQTALQQQNTTTIESLSIESSLNTAINLAV